VKRKSENSLLFFDSLKNESSMRLLENFTESKLSLASIQYHNNRNHASFFVPYESKLQSMETGRADSQ
jgi:hypothetical protein